MDGILIINKDKGMTSHDVVFKLRKILNTKKIGHSGTLDPDATGILIILIGKACKVLPFIEDVDKTYIARLVLGKKTFTDDIFGEVLEKKDIKPIKDFNHLLKQFKGEITQLPPMVSSVKVNGKKLYEYARNNETVTRPLRKAMIYEIEPINVDLLTFKVHCSSGTYIRSLCVDLASMSDNIGCMGELKRVKVGRFSLDDAYTIEEVEAGNYKLHTTFELLSHLTIVEYDNIEEVKQGKRIKLNTNSNRVVITHQKEVIAIYDRYQEDVFKCVRGLF